MIEIDFYRAILRSLAADPRITVWHLAIIHAILYLAKEKKLTEPISITRKNMMKFAHIRNFMTYHKYMKELQEFGYIHYWPSFHPYNGSKVQLCNFPDSLELAYDMKMQEN